ncbi:hypothetical protein PROFUN_13002, partial [Planoprotostelium fungivorum]
MEALDQIVSVVSEVILIFEQAQRSAAAQIIMAKANFDLVCSEIRRMVTLNQGQSGRIPVLDLRTKMDQSNAAITDATHRLQHLVQSKAPLNNGTYTIVRDIYDPFHGILKEIIFEMVKQLQIIDQSNVQIIIDSSRKNLELLIRLKNSDHEEAVNLLDAEIRKGSADFVTHVTQRLSESSDFELRQKLSNGAETIKRNHPVLIETAKKDVRTRTSFSKTERDNALKTHIQALQDIVNAVNSSSKYISGFSLLFELPPSLLEGWRRNPIVEEALSRLYAAVKRGDRDGALKAIQDLIDETNRQIAEGKLFAQSMKDPAKRDALLKDIKALEDVVAKLVAQAKLALDNPNDAAIMAELERLIEEARLLNRRVQAAREPETEFVNATSQLQAIMAKLLAAAKMGQAPEVVAASKELLELMGQQSANGRRYAAGVEDPDRKKAILDACNELDRLAPLILQAAKKVLENPKDQNAVRELEELMARAKLTNQKLNAAILENELAKNLALGKELFDKLDEAVHNRDAEQVKERLKDLHDVVGRRIELGKKLAAETTDPAKKNQILDAVAFLQTGLPKLGDHANKYLSNPTPENLKKYDNHSAAMQDAAERVTAEQLFPAKDVYGQTQSAHSRLDLALERLAAAVRRGDEKEASLAAAEVVEQLKRQAQLARDLAAKCTDATLKKQLL